ncbi:MAG: carboxypeptidase regulatory-like domain-containing protein, partial [Anaerolineales bacterium]|nr:carboxypeptidase regulatory-like domain-containing protein [Anaerolineales bacterium]
MRTKAILLTIILIALLTPTVSAFEVGILKIDTPSRVMAGEQAEIKVTDLITGNPVSGADVQINGAKIGTTGSSGTLTYTFERGLYTITATKFGYTPAASLSLSVVVPDISTPTPTPTPTPEIYTPIPTPTEPPLEALNGLVISFKSGGQMQELVGMLGLSTIPGFLITSNNNYMLLGETALETGNYDVKGRALKSFYFDNKKWVIFNMVESNRLPPTTITFSELKNNPERYLLKEVSVKATIKEISVTADLEIIKVPVSIGILTDKPADPFKFTEELIESAKDYQKEPSWEKAKLILQDYEGIAVFRIEESYWKST